LWPKRRRKRFAFRYFAETLVEITLTLMSRWD
jgi:hypothetical protein